MDDAVEATRRKLATVRAGRATPELLDRIEVDAYGSGSRTPIAHMATIAAPEPRLLVVTPFDPSTLGAIERAISASDLGVNPSNDGRLIRLPMPPLTQQRRDELAKVVKGIAEDARIAIRNARKDANNTLKRMCTAGEIVENQQRGRTKVVQEATDEHIAQVDALLAAKLAELAEV